MRQFTRDEFIRILEANGYYYSRSSGSHSIYLNKEGRHVSIPHRIADVIARRLIKENKLETNIKKLKRNG